MAGRADSRNKASGMGRFYLILGAVAVVGAAILVQQITSNRTAATSPVEMVFENAAQLREMAQGVTKGDPDHPISIMLFVDYQCPACRQFAAMVEPQIDLQLIETGRANLVQYDFPIVLAHPHAFLAARAARCAGDQDRYKEYHDILFRNQDAWFYENEAVGTFGRYGDEIGLDGGTFRDCLESDRHAGVVTANMHFAEQLGISGTPSVLVLGGGELRRLSQTSFEALERIVAELEAEISDA